MIGAAASITSLWILLDHHANYLRRFNGFDTNAVVLLLGCALAAALHLGLRPPRTAAMLAALAGVVFLAATAFNGSVRQWTGAEPFGLALIGVAALTIICFVDRWPVGWAGRTLALRPLAYLGRISYGIYLWHYPILIFVIRNLHTRDSLWSVTVLTALTLPVAAASYWFVEAPFLLLQRRFRTTVTPSEPGAPAVSVTGDPQ